jgi:pyruvate kinase
VFKNVIRKPVLSGFLPPLHKGSAMKRNRMAKIIATIGPGTSSAEKLEALFVAGADVFRFNFSHGSHAEHKERYDVLRALEKKYNRPITLLIDLQGPKLRVGTFAQGAVQLKAGQTFRFDLDPTPGDQMRVNLPHPEIFAALQNDAILLLDDGRLRMKIQEHSTTHAQANVLVDGVLSDRKGVNLPNVMLPIGALTDKDKKDLQFGLELGMDWVALSFVQRPEDVAEAKDIIQGKAAIISKLEKPSAIDHLDSIIQLSDAIMVARGDLGVECPPETVPILQKKITNACRASGKPVVIATQMLDSMVSAPAPTRAEASDVATAIYDGADAVMLSAETAVGKYPVETIEIMGRIIENVEHDPVYSQIRNTWRGQPEHTAQDAISAAARQVAHTLNAACICTYTSSGSTTLRAARERPDVPLLCLTSSITTARRLGLAWGAHCVQTPDITNFADMVKKAIKIAKAEDFAHAGDGMVITAGVPFGTPGTTNILRIAWID